MKLILLSISLFALSFSDHIRTPKDISTSIELKIKKLGPLKKNSKDIPVEMFVINRNTFPVYLNNPSCWGATLPVITYNGVNVSPAIKVRVNSSCAKELVPVKSRDTLLVKFNYMIDQLIDLNKTGNYKLQFGYNGELFNEKKNKLNKLTLVSNEISFVVQD